MHWTVQEEPLYTLPAQSSTYYRRESHVAWKPYEEKSLRLLSLNKIMHCFRDHILLVVLHLAN